MNRRLTALSLMALAGMAAPAFAQDSVDKYAAGLPGDALDPWTAGVPNQKAAYVVDLTPLYTSCGTRFGIAPLIKSSRTNPAYFGSLFSAQSIKRPSEPQQVRTVPHRAFVAIERLQRLYIVLLAQVGLAEAEMNLLGGRILRD